MRLIRFICKKCGFAFERETFEHGNGKEKGLGGCTVRCEVCSGDIEKFQT